MLSIRFLRGTTKQQLSGRVKCINTPLVIHDDNAFGRCLNNRPHLCVLVSQMPGNCVQGLPEIAYFILPVQIDCDDVGKV